MTDGGRLAGWHDYQTRVLPSPPMLAVDADMLRRDILARTAPHYQSLAQPRTGTWTDLLFLQVGGWFGPRFCFSLRPLFS